MNDTENRINGDFIIFDKANERDLTVTAEIAIDDVLDHDPRTGRDTVVGREIVWIELSDVAPGVNHDEAQQLASNLYEGKDPGILCRVNG